jgi:negative regulator of sigma F NrsF-like protein
MNCDDITIQLARGGALNPAALEHAAGCSSCRSLMGPLENFEPLDHERLSTIRNQLVAGAAPVTPLSSDRVLIAFVTTVFLIFAAAVGYGVHMKALHALTAQQMAVYFSLIFLSALAGAAVVVGEMAPGSKWRSGAQTWMIGTALALPLTCVALFHSYDARRFVPIGLRCFSLGSISAIAAAFLLSLFLRKGFLAFPRSAARVTGFLAALAGVAVLALHCPLLSVPHIVVWHFGILLSAWLFGDMIGRRLESR